MKGDRSMQDRQSFHKDRETVAVLAEVEGQTSF